LDHKLLEFNQKCVILEVQNFNIFIFTTSGYALFLNRIPIVNNIYNSERERKNFKTVTLIGMILEWHP